MHGTVEIVRALIITDVQNDFCEGGSLAVLGGTAVASRINSLTDGQHGYAHVVATQDHHVDPDGHFSSHPDYKDSWPPHCVVGTTGVNFHSNLDTGPIEKVFRKGEYVAAYSGFEGIEEAGTLLADWLRQRGVDSVDIVGIATDYCVRATAIDSAQAGFRTRVLLDFTAGVSAETTVEAIVAMRALGVDVCGGAVDDPGAAAQD